MSRQSFHQQPRLCTWTCPELVSTALDAQVLLHLLDEPAHHPVLLRNPQTDLLLLSGGASAQAARGLAWWCYGQMHCERIFSQSYWSQVGLAYARTLLTAPGQSVSLFDLPRYLHSIADHGVLALVPVLHFLRDQGGLVSPLAQRLRLYA